MALVRENMRKVVSRAPVHDREALHVISVTGTLMDMLEVDAGRDIVVSVVGSIGVAESGVQQLGVSVNMNLVWRR